MHESSSMVQAYLRMRLKMLLCQIILCKSSEVFFKYVRYFPLTRTSKLFQLMFSCTLNLEKIPNKPHLSYALLNVRATCREYDTNSR